MTRRNAILLTSLCGICVIILSAFDIFRGRRDTMYQSALRTNAASIVLPPGIFVSTLGSDANAGLYSHSPVRSVPMGLQRAAQYGRTNVFVAKGVYSRGLGISAGSDGVIITNCAGLALLGGWENNFFSRSPSDRSVLDGGNAAYRVLLISNAQSLRVTGFAIVRGGTTAISGGGAAVIGVTSASLSDLSIMSNVGYNGGGMFVSNSTGITVSSSCFFSNYAQNYGGALMCVHSGDITIQNAHMLQGFGAAHAGGIYAQFSSNLVASNIFILSNNGGSGAAFSLDQTTNITFIRLTAASNALASQVIYLNNAGSFSLRNSFITNNAINGNMVLLSTARSLIISGCVFSGSGITTYGIQELIAETGQTFVSNGFMMGSMTWLYHDTVIADTVFTVDGAGIANFNIEGQTGAAVSSGNYLY
ncbi:MAG: hypothetical protein AABZ39_10845 [Spirochaetota bacterium]